MYLIETFNKDNFTELIIFSRDKSGKKITKTVSNFKPYFFIKEDEDVPSNSRICSIEKGYTSIAGEKVKKIITKTAKDVSELRELFKKTYESDILFANRYIVDVLGEVETYPLKVLSFDIETDDINGFPNFEKPEQIITCVSFCDNSGKKIAFLNKHKDSKITKTNDFVKICNSEEDMLNNVINYFVTEDPDIITGWAINNFDIPYMISRMKYLKLDYAKISPLKSVIIKQADKYNDSISVKIRGRVVLDGMEMYEHFRKISNQGRAESYSLEFTSQEVLGAGKVSHDDNFHDMWVNQPDLLVEYNLRDSELVINILNKLDIVDFFNSIRSKSFCQLEDIYTTTKLVDGLLLHKCHNKIILPSKNKLRDGKKFGGAHVFTPKPGLYDYVVVYDVSGMYPNLIKSFNIGYETFNPNGEIKLKEGTGFNKGIGLISQVMRELEVERNHYKKLAKESKTDTEFKNNDYKQYAIKVLMNSFYGYLGYAGSRLYKKDVAEAITIWGQLLIAYVEDTLKNKGYELIYGDTDSIFFSVKSKKLSLVKIEANELLKEVNNSFMTFVNKYGSDECTLAMEFEKIFKKAIFVGKKGGKKDEESVGAKKKYAYIIAWNSKKGDSISGKFDITGFDGKRSDNARISKSVQLKILNMILNDASKIEVESYIKEIDDKIRSGEIGIEEIGFPKGITKDLDTYGKDKSVDGENVRIGIPPVIRGCNYANKYLGKRFGAKSKPKWVYIKSVPEEYPHTDVLSFEHDIPKGFLVDYDIMIEKILKMKLEEIFKSAGFGDFPDFHPKETEKKVRQRSVKQEKLIENSITIKQLTDYV